MVVRHVRGFVSRRLSREEYLGLHLTIGLFLSLVLLAVFVLIARNVTGHERLIQFDDEVGREVSAYRAEAPIVRHCFLTITWLGSVEVMAALALLGSLVLLLRHHWIQAFIWIIGAAGGGLLDMALKQFFERERPPAPLRDVAISETTRSFPSGHSMGSLIGYGLLAYFLVLKLPRHWQRVAVAGLLALLVLAIGFSRIFMGAHYFSDVLGGFAVGGFWLGVCISAMETLRRRKRALSRAAEDLGG